MPFVDSRLSTFLLSTLDFFTLDSQLFYSRLSTFYSRLSTFTLDFYSRLSTITLDIYSRPSTFRYTRHFQLQSTFPALSNTWHSTCIKLQRFGQTNTHGIIIYYSETDLPSFSSAFILKRKPFFIGSIILYSYVITSLNRG